MTDIALWSNMMVQRVSISFLFEYVRYGLIWISTTLVFVLASLGNCATYLMEKHTSSSTSWSFDVSYVNMAASVTYGYAILVPLAYYFLIKYMGSNASLVRFWCLWGYSLFVFILSSVSICILLRLLSFFYLKNSLPLFWKLQ